MQDDLTKLVSDRLGIPALAAIPNRHGTGGYRLSCQGSEVLERWRQLRELVDESGYWPVILGDDKEVSRILGIEERPPQQILDEAATQTSEQWQAARIESRTEQEGALRGIFEKRYGARRGNVEANGAAEGKRSATVSARRVARSTSPHDQLHDSI